MSPASGSASDGSRDRTAIAPILISLGWLLLVVPTALRLDPEGRRLVLLASSLPIAWTWAIRSWERFSRAGRTGYFPVDTPAEPTQAASASHAQPIASGSGELAMTRSGLYASMPVDDPSSADDSRTGEFAITDMVNRLDPVDFRWLDSSLAEQEFLGWSLSELEDLSFLQVIHPDDRERARDALEQAIIRGDSHGHIFRIKTALGETKAVELNASARYKAGQRLSYLRCHLSDVTEKIRSERELRLRSRELIRLNEQLRGINRQLEELKDRYSELYDDVPTMCFSLDDRGRIIECNRTFLATVRLRREEALGRSFFTLPHPDDDERIHAMFAEVFRKGTIEGEGRWIVAGGQTIEVWFRGTVSRARSESHAQVRCVAEDVTAKHRLESEIRATNRSLAVANAELSLRNQELDEFVYVVSHDLQEPLRTLQVFSDFLLRDHADQIEPEGRQFIHYLADASRRLQAMVYGLLNLARAGKLDREIGDISFHELIDIVKADLSARIRDRRAEVLVEGADVSIRGEQWRLQRLFTNLISNAIKYNQSEAPRVVVGATADPGRPPDEGEAGPDGSSMVRLFVRDNGIGIDPRNHQKIFHIFRRLHSSEEYEGIGAGLAICAKIVQSHGGRIWVESRLGEGATFYVTLPRSPERPAGAEPAVDRDTA
ncbi:sensor histidine kinase [Aquisphaera insulae]|uniref:sensor histidine kinase n=1 Tax=Aquisphaera insulae TaxID=2712864 RepID=UPI0013EE3853|nr:PAS domain S-box protein [Aquisphaera insulae]